jgi:spermidine synthase
MPRWLVILLVSMAGLLLEVSYTRIVSYKLWYYYTYLVIGLALLGIGSGSVLVVVCGPLRRRTTETIIAVSSLCGAIAISVGYLVVAQIHIDTTAIWEYGTEASFENLGRLFLICFTIFLGFVPFGVIVSILLGRAGEASGEKGIARIYFADLLGAGLGCLLAIPLIVRIGPPSVIMLGALVFAVVGLLSTTSLSLRGLSAIATVALLVPVLAQSVLPDIRTEDRKEHAPVTEASDWGPVFRVEVISPPGSDGSNVLLLHDATFGSRINRWDGNPASMADYYAKDPRSLPFDILGTPPQKELIIGSAGGNEILASLTNHAPDIEAVELNPVTTDLLTANKKFADYSGHLADQPQVHMHQGDGRSYLARGDSNYDLVWYVAPDSYAATNAASSGAFVLSESYLYTTEMIEETMKHLNDDGIMVVQFGELDFANDPARTSRYIVTARKALENLGITDPSQHILVGATGLEGGNLSTIAVSKSPITPEAADRFIAGSAKLPDSRAVAVPGRDVGDTSIVHQLASGTNAQVQTLVDNSPRAIDPVTDDAPYFWHFSRFSDVISHIGQSLDAKNPEDVIGERVLLLLLAIAVIYAALFLVAPFFFVRRTWRTLPAKGTSAIYFAALGLGFMFFEVTMIQRLVQFLGYPTYSLTVTLAAMLISTGLGALLSRHFVPNANKAVPVAFAVLVGLTLFYLFALPSLLTGPLLSAGLSVRIAATVVFLFPLGLCLGMFMPLGLGRITELTSHDEEYVAWAWAVNGFFAVIGSVLTTILSMALGFRMVQALALVVYAIAAFTFTRLPKSARPEPLDITDTGEPDLVPV